MPATLHIGSRMTSGRFVILEQNETQAPNGLVTVGVTYSVNPSAVSNLSQIFYLDAPPPVFPTSTQKSTLQSAQGLYLLDHLVSKQNGLTTIQATYVGARNIFSGQKMFITRDAESRVTPPIRLSAGFDLTAEEPPREIAQYDTVVVRFVAQVVTTEQAGVGAGLFDLEKTEQVASNLIYRVEYGNLQRSAPDFRTRRLLPPPRSLLDNFRPYVEVSTSIRNVTNNVIIAVTTRNVVFDPLALDAAVNR
jgi:hypothetical protein